MEFILNLIKLFFFISFIIFSTVAFFQVTNSKSKFNKWLSKQTYWVRLILTVAYIIFAPLYLIYFFDKCNLFSFLGIVDGIDTKEYKYHIVEMLSAGLGAYVLITTTRIQIENSEKQHQEKMLEDKKNNNMPLLSFDINENISESDIFAANKLLMGDFNNASINNDYKYYNLCITNIGLNAAKNVSVKIKNNKHNNYITKITQSVIGKGQEEHATILFSYSELKKEKVIIEVRYEDLFGNAYKQLIIIELEITTYHSNNGRVIVMSFLANEPKDYKKIVNKSK